MASVRPKLPYPLQPAAPVRWLQRLASLRLTLVILVLLGVVVVLGFYGRLSLSWGLAAVLGLFALNLIAAVLVNPVVRRQTALLLFHLALLTIIVLIAISRLTYLEGSAEVSTGQAFEGRLTDFEAGPLHPWHVRELRFHNEGFEVGFNRPGSRGKTWNRVRWQEDGLGYRQLIGDNNPLILGGYRFYATPNNGFAATFAWQPAGGALQVGTVHFPAYPLLDLQQDNEWMLPDGKTQAWVKLDFDQTLIAEDRPSVLRPPDPHRLILRFDGQRHVLQPGQTLPLAGGTLAYWGLTTWMGYQVYYDPALPWVLAAAVFAVLCLGWHFWAKCRQRPWQPTPAETGPTNRR